MAAKVDLITGFLGSGKTTFIQTYARYLMRQGQRVGIIENDYGSVNVDMMLLQELEREGAVTEMAIGGDLSSHGDGHWRGSFLLQEKVPDKTDHHGHAESGPCPG